MTEAVSRRALFGRFLQRWQQPDLPQAVSPAPVQSASVPAPTVPAPTVPAPTVTAPTVPARIGLAARPFPVLRPPGAVPEADFLAGCTRCGDCVPACPHGAIVPAPERMRGAAGTPMLDPLQSPCLLCADRPCATACAPRVLRADLPARMGRAAVLMHQCLVGLGSSCSVCVERCPVPGALRLVGGRPQVDVALCNGCGICQHVCPAPSNAVLLVPTLERPAPQETR